MKNNIAIILARGGSKGLPGKNIKSFMGLALVEWTILQAKLSTNVNSVYLSSDSNEILAFGSKHGINLIQRPEELSQDNSRSEDAVLHAISTIDEDIDAIVMLEPTAPLRKKSDIDNAINKFYLENLDSCFSGALLDDFLIWKKDDDGELTSVNYDYKIQGPRQERKPDYVENGAIFVFKPEVILKENNRFGGKIGISLNEFWQSFEIDDLDGFELVEFIFDKYLKKEYKKHINIESYRND